MNQLPKELREAVKRVTNEEEYRHYVLNPLLHEHLGYPRDPRIVGHNKGFSVYGGNYEIDTLVTIDGRQMLAAEAKASARKFDDAYTQVTFYSKNCKEGSVISFVAVAAGERVAFYHAVTGPDGIGVIFELLDEFVDFQTLQGLARGMRAPAPERIEEAAVEQFAEIIDRIYATFRNSPRLARKGDEAVIATGRILSAAVCGSDVGGLLREMRTGKRLGGAVIDCLGNYDWPGSRGPALARAFLEFLTLKKIYKGKSEDFGKEKIGRYMTPAHIIEFMVKLTGVSEDDRVIDMACGSGGFLAACAGRATDSRRRRFVEENLYGTDIDELSAVASSTLIRLLVPQNLSQVNVWRHNGLYSSKQRDDQADLSKTIKPGAFDVVIGNPPANASYCGTHVIYALRSLRIPDDEPSPHDNRLFIRRAMQLAKDGGRICLVVSDGVLANAELGFLREEMSASCRVKAVISVPRVFRNVSSKMSILYMEKTADPKRGGKVFLASVRQGIDETTGREYNVESELGEILKRYQEFAAAHQ